MASHPDPVEEHIRRMELRIEQQFASIERLRQSGLDTASAIHRLALLRRALAEMSIQFGQLSPTQLDAKRPNGIALTDLSGSGKA